MMELRLAVVLLGLSSGDAEPFLFMDLEDVQAPWGLLQPRAYTVTRNDTFAPPPLPYHNGAMPIAVLPSLGEPGSFEVYCSNSTDIFPNVAANLLSEVASISSSVTNNTLLRYTTRDFRHYSEPHVACRLAGGIDWKSIARDDASGRYVMIVHYDRSSFTYVSDNAGLSFRLLPSGEVPGGHYGDKDDLNLIHNKGRFVDMQIVYQEWTLRYCDNAGCDRRRVISTKTSSDGSNWSVDQGLIQPDAQDPPELQFYRIRPFYVGNTSRLAAHVFTYAPSPQQSIVGEDYGLQPSACSQANDKKWAKMPPFKPYNPRCENGGCCHGPHLFEEWWIGPQSGDAADTRGWRRPFRNTHGAPHDEPLMAQPVPFDNMLLWVGWGYVYTLPAERVSGIYAPANGEFSSPVFTMPNGATAINSGLYLNAAASWHGKVVTGGCDEGCTAYIFAELTNAGSGLPLPGFERTAFQTMKHIDGERLPLLWGKGGNNKNATVPPAGIGGTAQVRLRIFFRDATIFALNIGQTEGK